MKRVWVFLGNGVALCVLTAVYVILTEQISVVNIVIGAVVSAFALLITQRLFLKQGLLLPLSFAVWYFVFVLYLFAQILKNAAASLRLILGRQTCVMMVQYKTALRSESLKCMLANAITLTPGTVTADIKDDVLEILKLGKPIDSDDATAFERIERILMRMDKGNE